MKSHHLFLLLLFFLASCTPSTPVPTVTPVPTTTSTLTPVPTITPTATPEPWVAIVDEYGLPEEMAKELGDQEFIVSETIYGMLLKDETGTVLFEQIRGEWRKAKHYEWVTAVENFEDAYIPPEEILDGSLHDWAMREVIPNVEYEDNRTDKTKFRVSSYGTLFFYGYPGKSIKGAAYLYTSFGELNYRVIVGVLEGEDGKDVPVVRVAGYYPDIDNPKNFNKAWNTMRIASIIFGSQDYFGEEEPIVEKSQKIIGENLTLADLKKYIPEKVAEWEGIDAPIGSMFALLDLLSPEQLAEFEPGEGGLVLALYMYQKGDPSFISYPGLILNTHAAIGKLYE